MVHSGTIAIVASGGGHTGYAKAVSERLIEICEGIRILFILPKGDSWSLSRLRTLYDQARRRNIDLIFSFVTKPREPGEHIIRMILRTPIALFEAFNVLRKYKPKLVLATGSNHSLIVALAALMMGIRVVCVEAIDRIATPSKAVKVMHDMGVPILLHWIEQKRILPKGIVVGPIYERAKHKILDEGFILVTTGTMGHRRLFNIIKDTGLENVVMQTGKISPEEYQKPGWKVFRFDPDIDRWISKASVIITHQGLTAANAALAYRKPVIIVYNPDLKNSSTRIDTLMLAKKMGSLYMEPDMITPELLVKAIRYAAKKLGPPKYIDGALVAARFLCKLLCS